jgi:hypothetical protein
MVKKCHPYRACLGASEIEGIKIPYYSILNSKVFWSHQSSLLPLVPDEPQVITIHPKGMCILLICFSFTTLYKYTFFIYKLGYVYIQDEYN